MKPVDQRYFEDFPQGLVLEFGHIEVKQKEVVDFAMRYDPQYFHTDPEQASKSIYGGLIASGWHTVSMMMRLLVDNYLPSLASLGSLGIDELRWKKPVYPGDSLSVKVTVLESKVSISKPERGVITSLIEVFNQQIICFISLISLIIFIRKQVTNIPE